LLLYADFTNSKRCQCLKNSDHNDYVKP
jgi:hypothetical protein